MTRFSLKLNMIIVSALFICVLVTPSHVVVGETSAEEGSCLKDSCKDDTENVTVEQVDIVEEVVDDKEQQQDGVTGQETQGSSNDLDEEVEVETEETGEYVIVEEEGDMERRTEKEEGIDREQENDEDVDQLDDDDVQWQKTVKEFNKLAEDMKDSVNPETGDEKMKKKSAKSSKLEGESNIDKKRDEVLTQTTEEMKKLTAELKELLKTSPELKNKEDVSLEEEEDHSHQEEPETSPELKNKEDTSLEEEEDHSHQEEPENLSQVFFNSLDPDLQQVVTSYRNGDFTDYEEFEAEMDKAFQNMKGCGK